MKYRQECKKQIKQFLSFHAEYQKLNKKLQKLVLITHYEIILTLKEDNFLNWSLIMWKKLRNRHPNCTHPYTLSFTYFNKLTSPKTTWWERNTLSRIVLWKNLPNYSNLSKYITIFTTTIRLIFQSKCFNKKKYLQV